MEIDMSSKRTNQEFMQLAQALDLSPISAAEIVMDKVRLGKKLPRWMRRAARSLTRRAQAS
jgi:hypothetical protein